MNANTFDRYTRAFGKRANRRGLLAVAGSFIAFRSRATDAAQLPAASCAATGEVCTLLFGCCTGLSCATGATNPSYGVCVPGDGGMVTSGTALVVPFDGEDAAAAQPAVDTADTTTPTTDPEAEREQKLAEKKARKDAHRNRVELRRDDRRDDRKTRNDDKQERRELNRGPELEFRLTLPTVDDDREYLKVTSRDNDSLVINRIESIRSDGDFSEGTPIVTLSPGESFVFISGDASGANGSRLDWTNARICENDSGGFNVIAGFNTNSDNFEYEILCDGPSIVLFEHPDQKKKGNQNNNRKRQKRKNKSRGNKKHKNG